MDAGEAGATVQELDLDEGTFTVQPGQEVVYCVRIPLPAQFQGRHLGGLDRLRAQASLFHVLRHDPDGRDRAGPVRGH